MRDQDIYRTMAEILLESVKESDVAVRAAVLAERERCAKIAEIEYMTPKDIARVIRSNWPQE